MQTIKESPQFVQTSLAGAICLGLETGRFMPKSQCKCLNLLLTYTSGCRASCSYCGLARNRQEDTSKTFIRVKWPTYSVAEILERVKRGRHPFKRVCVSMITHGHAVDDSCTIISQVSGTSLPISGLLAPTIMKGKYDLKKLKEAGLDRVGIAIDAATEELFAMHRGAGVSGPHQWKLFWQTLADAVEIFGAYKAGVHLIVGLGETEEQMVKTISRAYGMGALTHLFSFYPESGSLMQNSPQPPLGKYRRVQLARYLINEGIIKKIDDMGFSPEGQIIDFGCDIMPYIQNGEAFMTSGCPGKDGQVACNRPFGNERASEPMRNYPFLPGAEEMGIILPQIWDEIK